MNRLEASHVKLMTDHEVFWSHHREFVAQQERNRERHEAFFAEQERAWAGSTSWLARSGH
jgi:hypothetical protein